MIGQRLEQVSFFCLAFGGEIAPHPSAGVQHARPRGLGQDRKAQHAMRFQPVRPFGLVGEHGTRRDRAIDGVGATLAGQGLAPGVELFADRVKPGVAHLVQMVVGHHRGLGQIGQQAFQPVVEPGQPVFHPGHLAPGADAFVQRIVRAPAIFGAIVLAKPGDRGLVQDHLGHRGQVEVVQLLGRALGLGIEAAGRFQHVAEHVQPDRAGIARGIDVDDAASDREIAGLGHGGRLGKAHAGQKGAQRPFVHAVAHAGGKAGLAQRITGRHPLHGGGKGRQQDEGPLDRAVRQGGQHCHARRHHRRRGRDAVIGRGVPCGKFQHHRLGRKEAKRRAHRGHAPVVAGDMDDGRASGQLAGDQRRVKALGRPGKDQMFGHAV